VTLFFGGPQPLSIDIGSIQWDGDLFLGPLNGTVWFLLKLMVFLYVYVWFRATLPRLRYDQLMNLGWKILIPVSLGWFMLLAAFKLGQQEGWNRVLVGAIGLAIIGGGAALLAAATKVSARNREREGAMF